MLLTNSEKLIFTKNEPIPMLQASRVYFKSYNVFLIVNILFSIIFLPQIQIHKAVNPDVIEKKMNSQVLSIWLLLSLLKYYEITINFIDKKK